METIEVLKNVQRIALECMIGRKPVHINVGVMPEISRGSLHGDIQ